MPEAALTSQIRHHLFLCCKEALHNVVKHAQATEVVVRMSVDRGSLVVTISDNGRGIPVLNGETPPNTEHLTSGNGWRNMRQRMVEIGGTCTIAARPLGGTVVTFVIPLRITRAG